MSLALIFDLDDTIYFQKDQFVSAVKDIFPNFPSSDIDCLYDYFRKYSELTFFEHERGEIGLTEMRKKRIRLAFKELDWEINDELALKWQEQYNYYQNHLSMSPIMADILDLCLERGVTLGIISNGPSEHQRNKMNSLKIEKWIPDSMILVSEDIEITKPDKRIFSYYAKRLNHDRVIYIGDNYDNDVVGSSNFGWESIWLDIHDENRVDNLANYTVSNHEELKKLIIEILEDYL